MRNYRTGEYAPSPPIVYRKLRYISGVTGITLPSDYLHELDWNFDDYIKITKKAGGIFLRKANMK